MMEKLEEFIGKMVAMFDAIMRIEAKLDAITGASVGGGSVAAQKKTTKKKATKKKTSTAKITVESVKAQAKKIAIATDDAKACMQQIAELRNEVAESCYDDVNVGLDKFDVTGLTLFKEELDKYVYAAPEPEGPGDDLEI